MAKSDHIVVKNFYVLRNHIVMNAQEPLNEYVLDFLGEDGSRCTLSLTPDQMSEFHNRCTQEIEAGSSTTS